MSYQHIKNDGTTAEKAGRKTLPKGDKKVKFTMYEYPKVIELNGGMYKMKVKMSNSLKRAK